MAASESVQTRMMRRAVALEASVTPGQRSRRSSAPGSVARIVRLPTMPLISPVGPSATIRPPAMRMMRSAKVSASSR